MRKNNFTTKLYGKRDAFGFQTVSFPLCKAIYHLHVPMVSMHLNSFAIPIVFRIMVTFYHTTGPRWQDICQRVTKCQEILWQTHTDLVAQYKKSVCHMYANPISLNDLDFYGLSVAKLIRWKVLCMRQISFTLVRRASSDYID